MNAPLYEDMKTPPHSIDAEQSVLGGLMLDNSKWEDAAFLGERDFYRADHRLIFRAMHALATDALANKQEPVLDAITLSEYLNNINELVNAGGITYLGAMANDTPSAANIKAYIRIVKERAQRRELIAFHQDALEKAFTVKDAKPGELIAAAERELFAMGERAHTGEVLVTRANTVAKSTLEYIEAMSKLGDNELVGTTTGIAALDELTDGLQDGDLTVVGGRPSMGKTAFCGCLERAVVDNGGAALSFNLEMTNQQLMIRHFSAWSGIDSKTIKRGRLTDDDWPVLAGRAVKPLSDKDLLFVQKPGITCAEIVSIARHEHRQLQREGKSGLSMITIDYLQLLGTDAFSSENRATELGRITTALKQLAQELQCKVVLLSQLNRSLENRPNKRPVMSDLRESGAVEQDADVIIFLYRDEVYFPESPDKGSAELIVAKQRNGAIGTVRVAAQLHYSRFVDYTPDVYGEQYQ